MGEQQRLTQRVTDVLARLVSITELEDSLVVDGAATSVCRLRTREDGPNNSSRMVEQSAVVLEDEQLDFPQFQLQPKAGWLLGKMMKLMGGLGAIQFEDSPGFSDAYTLHGANEPATRTLFSSAVRDRLGTMTGWTVVAKGDAIVVYQAREIFEGPERKEFLDQALAVLATFRSGESELDATDIRRDTRTEDLEAMAGRMGGIAGRAIRAQLERLVIPRASLETFLRDEPPRRIPPRLKRQVLGQNLPLVFVGAAMCLAGCGIGTLLIATGGAPVPVGVLVILGGTVVGGLMAGLTLRHRRRKSRVVRDGTLTEAQITNVRTTSMAVNGEVRHQVFVTHEADGAPRKATWNAYGQSGDNARAAMESAQPVRILVDPKDPQHIVCVDLLMIREE